MISFFHYIKQNFYKKRVIVDCSDIRQVSGTLSNMFKDGIGVLPRNKKSPIVIPFRSILLIQKQDSEDWEKVSQSIEKADSEHCAALDKNAAVLEEKQCHK